LDVITICFFGIRWNEDSRKIVLSVLGVTPVISHGFKQRFNFYRGPDCETTERSHLASRLVETSFLCRSSNYPVAEEQIWTREPKERWRRATCYSWSIEPDCIGRFGIYNRPIAWKHLNCPEYLQSRLKFVSSRAITRIITLSRCEKIYMRKNIITNDLPRGNTAYKFKCLWHSEKEIL